MKQFITFEGIDGSGKSTISRRVFQQLKSDGYDVVLTSEPTGTKIGRYVQQCIKTQSDPFVTAFTFIADRMQHCTQIKQWLDRQKMVLCDRYAESTYAYQGAQLEAHIEKPMYWLQDLSRNRILLPDRTFVFVIDPKDALLRIQHREELIPFEQIAFLEKVHQNYLKLASSKRFLKLDATKEIQELVDICYNDIIQ